MTRYSSLSDLLQRGGAALTKGPIALIFCEDQTELESTIRHHQKLGFRSVIALMQDEFPLDETLEAEIHRVTFDVAVDGALASAVNTINAASIGQWIYFCYNAEYLFFPFCESRSIGELLAYHAEERRDAMVTFVVDLYAEDLGQFSDAVHLDTAHFDRTGYYALAREDADNSYHPLDRQLDFYGGLRWRFEEHVPYMRRKIDRISIFRAKSGLKMRENHTFSDEEYNTYSCPWHHNMTASIASFRTAKALKRNPGSAEEISTFLWANSVRFDWNSRQLMDLGLMEPGQWF